MSVALNPEARTFLEKQQKMITFLTGREHTVMHKPIHSLLSVPRQSESPGAQSGLPWQELAK